MKLFRVDKQALSREMAIVKSVISKEDVFANSKYLCLSVEKGSLILQARDMNNYYEAEIPVDCEVGLSIDDIGVDASTLESIINYPGDVVDIEIDGGLCKVNQDKFKASSTIVDFSDGYIFADDFEVSNGERLNDEFYTFNNYFQHIKKAADSNVLSRGNCVFIDGNAVFSTDEFRLNLLRTENSLIPNGHYRCLSLKSFNIVSLINDKHDVEDSVFGDNKLVLSGKMFTFACDLLTNEIPNYGYTTDAKREYTTILDKEELLKQLPHMKFAMEPEYGEIKLLSNKDMSVLKTSNEFNACVLEISKVHDGSLNLDEMELNFQHNHLLDCMKSFEGIKEIKMSFSGDSSVPVLFEADGFPVKQYIMRLV